MRNLIMFGLLCVILAVFVSAKYTADKKVDIEEVIRELQQTYNEDIDDGDIDGEIDEALTKSDSCVDICWGDTDCIKYCEDKKSSHPGKRSLNGAVSTATGNSWRPPWGIKKK